MGDVANNRGIGGTPGDNNSGILYPERDPQYHNHINKTPKDYIMDMDWLRVYKRANELYGLVLYLKDGTGKQQQQRSNLSKEVPVNRLAKVGLAISSS